MRWLYMGLGVGAVIVAMGVAVAWVLSILNFFFISLWLSV